MAGARLQEFESRRVKHTAEPGMSVDGARCTIFTDFAAAGRQGRHAVTRARLSQDEQWKAQHCRACVFSLPPSLFFLR